MMQIQLGIPPLTTPMPYVLSEYMNQVASEMMQKLSQANYQDQQAIFNTAFTPPVQLNISQNISQSNSQQSSNQNGSQNSSQQSKVDNWVQMKGIFSNASSGSTNQSAASAQSTSTQGVSKQNASSQQSIAIGSTQTAQTSAGQSQRGISGNNRRYGIDVYG